MSNDATRPVGVWIEETDGADNRYRICSLCGHGDYDVLNTGEQYRYCPRCGAKME